MRHRKKIGISNTALLFGGAVAVGAFLLYEMSKRSQPVILRPLPTTSPGSGIVPVVNAGAGIITTLINDLTGSGSSDTSGSGSGSTPIDLTSYGLTA